ncbi:EamA-like transporter family protein [Roseivivax sp. THAF40]|uniref:DMT family transporter n=1 Tax=unclassified Roseivivax TaxID=2639302 RepID=UPI001268942B|nr:MULTISPECIES: DMT family transporter [unclassified Roseivivax]QFS81209.1 EamA-like transporter family protein [Roseivivax sp. THAF197b]QFT44955.1 EamA-like transporter family protein [Roseivivax sp. THAF40]
MQALTPNLKGALLGLLGYAIYATNDIVIKVLGQTYAPLQTLFFLVLFGFPITLLMLMSDPAEASLRPRRPLWVGLRVVGYILNSICAFYAFAVLPLAQVYSLLFTAPLMITLLAWPILGERLGAHRLVAILVGFAGVLIILRPGSSTELGLGHLAAFGAAFGGALAAVSGRKVSGVERSAVLLLYPMLAAFVLSGMALPAVYKPVPLEHLALFGLVAALNFSAQLTVIAAFRSGEAAVVSPMNYSQILWAAAFGALLFGETIDNSTLIGSIVVIASGLYIVVREQTGGRSVVRPVMTTLSRFSIAPAALRVANYRGRKARRE